MSVLRHILGLSAFYHDAAAVLLRDGQLVAAAQEERFSRKKNDPDFPKQAIGFCLRQGGLSLAQIDAVVFYDKPILKFTRMLETYLAIVPSGWRTFPFVLPDWLVEKLNLPKTIRQELPDLRPDCQLLFTEHHQAHAASAFYPSPFDEAAILTIDGVGEWATTTIGRGRGSELRLLQELRFPHSLGLLYSAFTAYCGFRINSGEYKLMGLAPYGSPAYAEAIYRELIDLKPDGSFWLNLDYFSFLHGTTMTNERFHRLFEGPPRQAEYPIEARHMDVARSIQVVTEEIMLRLARHARAVTGLKNLCLAGGVALNCVANGRILRERIFERLWIQPAAGDAGGALGAAWAAWHGGANPKSETRIRKPEEDEFRDEKAGRKTRSQPRPLSPSDSSVYTSPKIGLQPPRPWAMRNGTPTTNGGKTRCVNRSTPSDGKRDAKDAMQAALLGPEYSNEEIEATLRTHGAVYQRLEPDALLDFTVGLLQTEKVIGWFQGRMEFGPRALGNRSILGDPRSPRMQSVMNLKVKFRESFRPFAPIVRRERVADYFELEAESPYMLLVAPVKTELRSPLPPGVHGLELLKARRSTLPAITHVDYSARIQTVERDTNPLLYNLLLRFEQATGCGVLVNTSFNVRGEPIVCSPDDAYRCFINTEMDYLILGNYVINRTEQPHKRLERRRPLLPD